MRKRENIYKRKDGRWEARYRKGRNSSGAPIYGSCYGKTYSEAKAKMEQAGQRLDCIPTPALPRGNIPSFGGICDEWNPGFFSITFPGAPDNRTDTYVDGREICSIHFQSARGAAQTDA